MPPHFANGVGDRAADQRLVAGDYTKPPVLSRRTQVWLCLASLAVILYGTLGPLGIHNRAWLAPAPNWSWVPPLLHSDYNDLLTNLAVYVPVGVCLRLLLRRRGRAGWRDLLPAWLLSVLLSYGTELLQQFMPARSANLMDVYVNSSAALLGCLIAAPAQHFARRVHAQAFDSVHSRRGLWTILVWTLIGLMFIVMTSPWRLHHPRVMLGLEEPARMSDHLWLARFAVFAAIGFVVAGRALSRGEEPREVILRTVLRVGSLALLLELAQAALSEHVSSVLHAAMAGAGTACGALIAARRVQPPEPSGSLGRPAPPPTMTAPLLGPRARRVVLFVLLAMVLYATISSALIHTDRSAIRTEPAFTWIPFRAQFEATFSHMLADVFQQCVLFGFLTFLCLYLTQGHARVAALLLLLGMIGTVEIGRACLSGRGAATTGLLLATFSWWVTSRMWSSLYPGPRPDLRVQAT